MKKSYAHKKYAASSIKQLLPGAVVGIIAILLFVAACLGVGFLLAWLV